MTRSKSQAAVVAERKTANAFERLRRAARSVLAGAPLAKMIDRIDTEERLVIQVIDGLDAPRLN